MDINYIRQLAEILAQHGLSALEIKEGDDRIRMERRPDAPSTAPQAAVPAAVQPAPAAPPPAVDFNNITEIKSPMVGVFYAAAAPDAAPYVKVGDHVKRGDVLCIIEAMKLLNEIVAEVDGEIADICVDNGQVVEFSQTLFKIY